MITQKKADMAEEGNKLILLDWDDTLCPSTWMKEEGVFSSFSPCGTGHFLG